MPKLFIIVPVLNEANNRPRLFEGFQRLHAQFSTRFCLTILLVDVIQPHSALSSAKLPISS